MYSKVRKFRIMFPVILLCLSFSSQITVHVMATKGSYPGANGKIAFSDYVEGGDTEIFVMNGDGTGVVRLTFNETKDQDPCWSPDGQWIAFVNTDGRQRWEIWVIKADGTGLRQVTTPPDGSSDNYPAWSPDGKTILFQRFNSSFRLNIYRIDAESTGVGVKLIEDASFPCWSPDGSMIAYKNSNDNRIWLADSTTGAPLFRVTSSEGEHPCWSPDGSQIVYVNVDDDAEIWVIDVDGSNDQQITDPPHEKEDEAPNWSPDGKKILFDREGDSIWIVNPDGSGAYDLTPSLPEARHPDWQRLPVPEVPIGGELTSNINNVGTWALAATTAAAAALGLMFKKKIAQARAC